MNLAFRYPIIYWNTACLIVDSGGDGATSDYAKIAQSVNRSRDAGINISLVDINKSALGFKPDAANNTILFGLKGLNSVGDDLIQDIITNRPYVSILDFMNRVRPNKQAMISLIKSGAFDQFTPRLEAMVTYIWLTCDKKSRITLQNLPGLIRNGLLPEDTEERIMARRVYEFNRYLKAKCKQSNGDYLLDTRALDFMSQLDKLNLVDDNSVLSAKVWDKQVYQTWMDVFRTWISDNKEKILDDLNTRIFMADWQKYGKNGNISSWEMEALCFYYHEHELAHVNAQKYGLMRFAQLPVEPVVEKFFNRGQTKIPIYKLYNICGTCIAKDKAKGIVYLLTTSGVVPVRFRKEYFAVFDSQLSKKNPDGSKTIVEKSWFNRGNMIIVKGIRRGDEFVPKKYKGSPGEMLYHIDEISKDGDLIIRHDRYKGEEDNE